MEALYFLDMTCEHPFSASMLVAAMEATRPGTEAADKHLILRTMQEVLAFGCHIPFRERHF